MSLYDLSWLQSKQYSIGVLKTTAFERSWCVRRKRPGDEQLFIYRDVTGDKVAWRVSCGKRYDGLFSAEINVCLDAALNVLSVRTAHRTYSSLRYTKRYQEALAPLIQKLM